AYNIGTIDFRKVRIIVENLADSIDVLPRDERRPKSMANLSPGYSQIQSGQNQRDRLHDDFAGQDCLFEIRRAVQPQVTHGLLLFGSPLLHVAEVPIEASAGFGP